MHDKKFDPSKLEKLNNPERLRDIPPGYLWEMLEMDRGGVVVEIGAGTGFFSVAFLPYAHPSRLYACDISDTMIDWMREHIVPDHPCIMPMKVEETATALDDEIADLVFMVSLHHELEHPDLTLRETYRILKPGGKILIVDWKKQSMTEGPPVRIRCVPGQVKEQLATAGFMPVRILEDLPKHFVVIGGKQAANA